MEMLWVSDEVKVLVKLYYIRNKEKQKNKIYIKNTDKMKCVFILSVLCLYR